MPPRGLRLCGIVDERYYDLLRLAQKYSAISVCIIKDESRAILPSYLSPLLRRSRFQQYGHARHAKYSLELKVVTVLQGLNHGCTLMLQRCQ